MSQIHQGASPILPSDSSDVPQPLYELAVVIFQARIRSAWGKSKPCEPPPRQRYGHNPHADFDLAPDCAKAVLKRYELVERAA